MASSVEMLTYIDRLHRVASPIFRDGAFNQQTNPAFNLNQVETLLNQTLDLVQRNQAEVDKVLDLKVRLSQQATEYYSQLKQLELLESTIRSQRHRLMSDAANAELKANTDYIMSTGHTDPFAIWKGVGGILERLMTIQNFVQDDKQNTQAVNQAVIERFRADLQYCLGINLIPMYQARAASADSDVANLEATADYLREVLNRKAEAMLPGGDLDFESRIADMGDQIAQDRRDISNRVVAADKGLSTIFGANAINGYFEPPSLATATLGQLQKWVRASVAWMAAYTQNDLTITEVISLREIDKDAWSVALAALLNQGTCSINFGWSGGALKQFRNARVLGISACSVNLEANRLQATVSLPSQANYCDDSATIRSVDQSYLPKVFIGRISSKSDFRQPELVGASAIRNASPFGANTDAGQWLLTIESSGCRRLDNGIPSDLLLEVVAIVNGAV